MTRQFAVSEEAKRKIQKQQKKRSLVWKKNLIIRILIWLSLPITIYKGYFMVEGVPDIGIILAVGIWSVPVIVYYAILSRYAAFHTLRLEEMLVLKENSIFNRYAPLGRATRYRGRYVIDYFVDVEIFYTEITKIEWYEYYQTVKIYAPVHYQCFWSNLLKDKSKAGTLTGENGFRLFYEYYHDFPEFVREISERSGVSVERISEGTKLVREVPLEK